MQQRPVHPGQVLAQKLDARGVKPAELARQIAVPANRISQIIHAKRAISGDTALRLAHWFETTPEFWLHLQAAYDLYIARQQAGQSIAALPTLMGARSRQRRSHGTFLPKGKVAERRQG